MAPIVKRRKGAEAIKNSTERRRAQLAAVEQRTAIKKFAEMKRMRMEADKAQAERAKRVEEQRERNIKANERLRKFEAFTDRVYTFFSTLGRKKH